MAIFKKKDVKKANPGTDELFFIRVFSENWIPVVNCLRNNYEKRDIRIVDDTAAVDGGERDVVRVYFEGTIDDYVNVLVDLAKDGINKVKEVESAEVEKK